MCAMIEPASGYQAHPEFAPYPAPARAFAPGTSFAGAKYSHLGTLEDTSFVLLERKHTLYARKMEAWSGKGKNENVGIVKEQSP